MTSAVTIRGQTAIPVHIRERYNIKVRSRLEWIDDGHSISVVPIPANPIRGMRGRYRGAKLNAALRKYRKEDRYRE